VFSITGDFISFEEELIIDDEIDETEDLTDVLFI
jgi:hypothetical protein